ncbi:MAG TPA: class I adenylate-forming enzyme family protein [Planctomycetota bacterium]|nr:class I adenylate-forming enzyme family protein [Planctomycetota bacterium]
MNGLPIHTLHDVWTNTVEKFPRKTAVIWQDRRYAYGELDAMVRNLATRLAGDFGLARGDRLAVAAPNCLEFYLTYWAAMRLGVALVPVNTRLRPDVMAFIVNETDARVLVVHKDLAETVAQIRGQLPETLKLVAVDSEMPGATSFASLLEPVDVPAPACEALSPDDVAVIVYTSGTTGLPKGPVITHGNLLYNIKNTIIPHSFRHEDVHMLVVPLFHCTGLNSIITTSAYLGGTVVIAPYPNVKELVSLIERHRVTTFLGVPTLFHFITAMKELSRYDLSSLRLIAYSGSPMPRGTILRLRERFPGVWLHNFFGLTETISITHVLADCDADLRPDSIGKLLPDVGQRIVDDDGNDVPPGTIGELCFHRSEIVREYWKRPGLLEESFTGDWFRTGDFALIDEQGYVYVKGRKKEMIIVGGENVYALEVENVILQHEKVLEAAVVGVEASGVRAYLGELVKAVVVRSDDSLGELELKRFCTGRLTSYQIPQIIEFRTELPRTPSGKVRKSELR